MARKEQKTLPFTLDRRNRLSLIEQMMDGIRSAITDGFYAADDLLPTQRELAKTFGLSLKVPRAALTRLAAEGVITTRRGLGCVVQPPRAKLWNGRVLVFSAGPVGSFYTGNLQATVCEGLVKAGYDVTTVNARRISNSRYDLSQLRSRLRQRYDLVFSMAGAPAIFKTLDKCGYPLVFSCRRTPGAPARAYFVGADLNVAVPDLVASSVKAGVRKVIQLRFGEAGMDAGPALEAAGIACTTWNAWAWFAKSYTRESMERAGMELMDAFLDSGKAELPDLFLFCDDIVGRGALMSMYAHGLLIPKDVKVVSWSNEGSGPVAPIRLARMLETPCADGEKVLSMMLGILRNERVEPVSLGPVYVPGESFPMPK